MYNRYRKPKQSIFNNPAFQIITSSVLAFLIGGVAYCIGYNDGKSGIKSNSAEKFINVIQEIKR